MADDQDDEAELFGFFYGLMGAIGLVAAAATAGCLLASWWGWL